MKKVLLIVGMCLSVCSSAFAEYGDWEALYNGLSSDHKTGSFTSTTGSGTALPSVGASGGGIVDTDVWATVAGYTYFADFYYLNRTNNETGIDYALENIKANGSYVRVTNSTCSSEGGAEAVGFTPVYTTSMGDGAFRYQVSNPTINTYTFQQFSSEFRSNNEYIMKRSDNHGGYTWTLCKPEYNVADISAGFTKTYDFVHQKTGQDELLLVWDMATPNDLTFDSVGVQITNVSNDYSYITRLAMYEDVDKSSSYTTGDILLTEINNVAEENLFVPSDILKDETKRYIITFDYDISLLPDGESYSFGVSMDYLSDYYLDDDRNYIVKSNITELYATNSHLDGISPVPVTSNVILRNSTLPIRTVSVKGTSLNDVTYNTSVNNEVVKYLVVEFSSDKDVLLESFKLDNSTSSDLLEDIAFIKLWKDSNGDGIVDGSDVQLTTVTTPSTTSLEFNVNQDLYGKTVKYIFQVGFDENVELSSPGTLYGILSLASVKAVWTEDSTKAAEVNSTNSIVQSAMIVLEAGSYTDTTDTGSDEEEIASDLTEEIDATEENSTEDDSDDSSLIGLAAGAAALSMMDDKNDSEVPGVSINDLNDF